MVHIGPSVAIATGQKPHFFSQTSLQLVLRNRSFWNLFLRNLEDISNVSYDHVPDQFLLVQKRWNPQYGYSTKRQGHLNKFWPEPHDSYIIELWWMIRPRIGPPTAQTTFFVFPMKPATEEKTCVFSWKLVLLQNDTPPRTIFFPILDILNWNFVYSSFDRIPPTYIFSIFDFLLFFPFLNLFPKAPMFYDSEVYIHCQISTVQNTSTKLCIVIGHMKGNIFVYHRIDVSRTAHAPDWKTCTFRNRQNQLWRSYKTVALHPYEEYSCHVGHSLSPLTFYFTAHAPDINFRQTFVFGNDGLFKPKSSNYFEFLITLIRPTCCP